MKKLIIASFFVFLTANFVSAQFKLDFNKMQAEHQKMARQKELFYKKLLAGVSAVTPNQKCYNVTYYGLDLDISPIAKTITGSVVIQARIVSDSLDRVELNLRNNMQVLAVTQDTLNLSYSHTGNILTVTLPLTYNKDEIFTFKVEYKGTPAASGFGAFGFNTHNGQPMIWSLSQPYGARNWWPCKDYPSDKADSVDINITVPSYLVVASNGTLKEVVDLGSKKTYRWQERYPIVTYLVSVAIHPYRVYSDWYKYSAVDSMEIQFYVFPDHYDRNFDDYAKTKDMIKAFSELYGQYPFLKEKYGHAEFLWPGGMEHQTITSLGGSAEWLIAHELSHQWWGDMITCDSFHHIWLNEGFATYSEAVWYEYQYGEEALHQVQEYKKYFGPGTIYVENPESENIFDYSLSYAKASWVVHMLRHVMGDSTFFEFLHTYYAHPLHHHGTATTAEFQAIAEEVSGLDLSVYFQQWIYQEGFPVYAYSWDIQQDDAGNSVINGGIIQTQTMGPVFQMPVDVTFRTAAGDTTIVVAVNQKITTFQVTLSEEPFEMILDKDDWILCQIEKISKPLLAVTGVQIDDSAGNNNGKIDPGELVNLTIQLQNLGTELTGVKGTLSTKNPQITILNNQSGFGDISPGNYATNESPFALSVLNETLPHVAQLTLVTSSDQGYRFNLDIYPEIGTSAILLVDDDNGENYERYYRQMAHKKQLALDLWQIREQGLPIDTLDHYDIVFWFTGNDRETSLTADEQLILQRFLERGGRLALSGANIGFDLIEYGTSADSLFFTDYLHAQYAEDAAGSDKLLGKGGDPIAGGLSVHFTGKHGGAGNQDSPSSINPLDSAVTVLKYLPSQKPAAIRYENLNSRSRLVYFAFGLEGIAGPRDNSAANLFQKTIIWLTGITSSVEKAVATSQLPMAFSMSPNFPNPFNPETQFRIEIPNESFIALKVYNLLGQQIRSLIEKQILPGVYEVNWNGCDDHGRIVSSGVYFYRLTTDNFSQTRKMLLMR